MMFEVRSCEIFEAISFICDVWSMRKHAYEVFEINFSLIWCMVKVRRCEVYKLKYLLIFLICEVLQLWNMKSYLLIMTSIDIFKLQKCEALKFWSFEVLKLCSIWSQFF